MSCGWRHSMSPHGKIGCQNSGFYQDVCLRHVRPLGADKNQLFEWLLFVIYWFKLVLFSPGGGGERCTRGLLGCRRKSVGFGLQPNVSTGHFVWRDLLPPSEEVRQTMALAWRVKSVLLLHRHVAFFLLSLPHLSLHSLPACLPTCFTAPSPLRGLGGLTQPDGKRHTPHIGKQATVSFCCETTRLKKNKRKTTFCFGRGWHHMHACAQPSSAVCTSCLPLTPESFNLTQVMD